MANFASILEGKSLGEFEKPKPLPEGSYEALIKGIDIGESAQKKTPYVRVNMEIQAPLDDVDADELDTFGNPQGRKVSRDFYITDDSTFMLQEFILEHVGLEDLRGTGFEQAVNELANQSVGVRIEHEHDKNDPERVYTRVTRTFNLSE